MEKIVIGIITAILGFVGGLLTPWIKWQVEKSKHKLASQKKMIQRCRDMLEPFDNNDISIIQTTEYSEIRAHLPEGLVNRLESEIWLAYKSARTSSRKTDLLDYLSELEKTWKLK